MTNPVALFVSLLPVQPAARSAAPRDEMQLLRPVRAAGIQCRLPPACPPARGTSSHLVLLQAVGCVLGAVPGAPAGPPGAHLEHAVRRRPRCQLRRRGRGAALGPGHPQARLLLAGPRRRVHLAGASCCFSRQGPTCSFSWQGLALHPPCRTALCSAVDATDRCACAEQQCVPPLAVWASPLPCSTAPPSAWAWTSGTWWWAGSPACSPCGPWRASTACSKWATVHMWAVVQWEGLYLLDLRLGQPCQEGRQAWACVACPLASQRAHPCRHPPAGVGGSAPPRGGRGPPTGRRLSCLARGCAGCGRRGTAALPGAPAAPVARAVPGHWLPAGGPAVCACPLPALSLKPSLCAPC